MTGEDSVTDEPAVGAGALRPKERSMRLATSVTLAVLCALSAVLTLADVHTPIRSGITVVSLVIGTGWAATCWIELKDAAFASTVAVATGLSIVFLYALVFLEVHWWHPVWSIGALLVLAAVVNAVASVREHGRPVTA